MDSTFLAALLGAFIGGGATLFAAWFSIKHERALNREVIEAERERARATAAHGAAAELLQSLLVMRDSITLLITRRWHVGMDEFQSMYLRWNYEDWTKTDPERIDAVLGSMRDGRASVHLIPSEDIRRRWNRIYDYCLALAYQSSSKSEFYHSRDLTQELTGEVRDYLDSVEDALRAYIDDRPLPPERLPPDFTDEIIAERFQRKVKEENSQQREYEEAERRSQHRPDRS